MTLTPLSLTGRQPDIVPAFATEPLSVCAMIANRYNPFSYMAAFPFPLSHCFLTRQVPFGASVVLLDDQMQIHLQEAPQVDQPSNSLDHKSFPTA